MAKPRIRNPGNRSGGGRPRKEGERFANGRLKPQGPNARTLEMRAALGVTDIGQAFTPIQIAARQGWLSSDLCRIAATFASIHTLAGLGRSASAVGADREVDAGAAVSGDPSAPSFFATLPHSEVVAIWDAVFSSVGEEPDSRQKREAQAMRQWKAANAAMTPAQRAEVFDVCILDSFPQWIIQRCAGRMATSWERKRDLLISGLQAIGQALRPAPRLTHGRTDEIPETSTPDRQGSVRREFYVSEDGQPLFEVERVYRLKPAA